MPATARSRRNSISVRFMGPRLSAVPWCALARCAVAAGAQLGGGTIAADRNQVSAQAAHADRVAAASGNEGIQEIADLSLGRQKVAAPLQIADVIRGALIGYRQRARLVGRLRNTAPADNETIGSRLAERPGTDVACLAEVARKERGGTLASTGLIARSSETVEAERATRV